MQMIFDSVIMEAVFENQVSNRFGPYPAIMGDKGDKKWLSLHLKMGQKTTILPLARLGCWYSGGVGGKIGRWRWNCIIARRGRRGYM